ncbi:hypothetical protein V1524DRAFT_438502 [Lipomyces starkeyi]
MHPCKIGLARACVQLFHQFGLPFAMPALFRSVSWSTFFIFDSFIIVAFINISFAPPETKQRTLEEMNEIFEHGQPSW